MKHIVLLNLVLVFITNAFCQDSQVVKINRDFYKKNKNLKKKDVIDLLKPYTNDNIEFLKVKENTTKRKYNNEEILHEKYQQYYKGIKVGEGTYFVHSAGEDVQSMSGRVVIVGEIPTEPLINKKEALNIAKNNIEAKTYIWNSLGIDNNPNDKNKGIKTENPLIIISDSTNNFRLAYKFIVETNGPLNSYSVSIDAMNGSLIELNQLLEDSNINKQGQAQTIYSDSQTIYTTYEPSKDSFHFYNDNSYGSIKVFDSKYQSTIQEKNRIYNKTNTWNITDWDDWGEHKAALDVSWGTWNVKQFLHDVVEIDSYDDSNGILECWIHYGLNYEGARSWPYNGDLVFGDGDGTTSRPWVSLDVVAHEIGHKIIWDALGENTTYRSGFTNGALNEGFSDLFAIGAENYIAPNDPVKDEWEFAEEVCITRPFARSFSNPNIQGLNNQHADTYEGTYWSTNDYTKSTIISHWFYIFNEGKSDTNDNGDSFDVNGIDDINESCKIVYNVLKGYLDPTDNFQNVKEKSINYIQTTYGDDSDEAINAMEAWYAVGVPGDCETIIQNKTISNSSVYADIAFDCDIEFSNISFLNGTNAKYTAPEVIISNTFEVPIGATLEINN